ncbi:MAG TPA: DUF3987 domain-containing protein [Candidatus Binatia bacterium]|nr:DUF3987 domain-containing protein [Candidatus Binatia bacterium]
MKVLTPTPEMFPPPLNLLRDACAHTEAHSAAVAVQFLVAVGNMVGREAHTYVGETRHGTNEFALIVGPTATGRKGDSKNTAVAPLEGADSEWFASITGGLSSGEGLIHAVRDPVYGANKKGEEVLVDPGVTDKRLLCVETEFSSVLKQFRREHNILSNTLREAWDGKRVLRTLTKTSPTRATDAHISLIGHATPEDLRAYLADLDVANGVVNRFLLTACSRPRLVPCPRRLPDEVRRRVTEHVRGVLSHARNIGHVPRTEAAEALWCKLYLDEKGLAAKRPGLLGALLARGPAHLTRLELIFALLASARARDVNHLIAAAAWWDYCVASAEVIFADRTGNDAADRIRAELLPGESMTLSEIREQLFANKIASGRLRDALALLRDLGEVTLTKRETDGRSAVVVTRVVAAAAAAGGA